MIYFDVVKLSYLSFGDKHFISLIRPNSVISRLNPIAIPRVGPIKRAAAPVT